MAGDCDWCVDAGVHVGGMGVVRVGVMCTRMDHARSPPGHHSCKDLCEERWIAGSSPAMTAWMEWRGSRKRASTGSSACACADDDTGWQSQTEIRTRAAAALPYAALFRLPRLRDATIRACEARRVP